MALPEVIKELLSRRSPSPPIIALLTDFGSSDHYVGAMKAVVASIHREARVIDISHEVRPQQVREGAYLLWASYRFFPAATIFVAVVDPGVGTQRRAIAVRTANYVFLAPDNGLLDFVLSEETILDSFAVNSEGSPYVLADISSTFHGRDIFAPVAAYHARGVDLREMGNPIQLERPASPFFVAKEGSGKPVVLHIDRFGNVITNIRKRMGSNLRGIQIGTKTINQWVKNYDEAPEKKPCLIAGSSGLVELIMKNDSAAGRLHATLKSTLKVLMK